MRTTQNLLNEGGTATAHESNEAQPVTIGYRLGFILVYMTRAITQLAISSAVCTRIPGVSRCFEPSSASLACIAGTPRHARIVHACAARQHPARFAPAYPARHAKGASRPCDQPAISVAD